MLCYEEAAEQLRRAEALLICAGAGMGVDSGLPDFRGNEGFWRAYPPYAKKGLGFTDMANPAWFENDPEFAWGFYGHRLNLYRNATPHPGFGILKKWAGAMPGGFFVFTSNVDGHFQKAGFAGDRILECHGSIHHLQCLRDCGRPVFEADLYEMEIDVDTMRARPPLPICPDCGGLARPNILMFGDWGWDSTREEVQSGNYRRWLNSVPIGKLVVVECGAGTGVPTVRYQSEQIARQLNGIVIRINVREPDISSPHLSIAKGAAEALSAMDEYKT
jgi:NAD-dependent SIR2 family protein deacetylase